MIGSSMCVDNNIFFKSPYIFHLTVQYHVVKNLLLRFKKAYYLCIVIIAMKLNDSQILMLR